MRNSTVIAALAAASALVASQGSARVAPITPEQKLMMDRQQALENAFRDRFSDGLFNIFRDYHGSIIVAEERVGRPARPRALAKDEHGWFELHESGRRSLAPQIANELDRLMLSGRLWAEEPYVKDAPCAKPQLFVLRYAGNQKFGRQCTPAGLTGRLAEVASTFRIPAGTGTTTAPPDPDSIGPVEDITGQVGNRSREMIYAWERRSLAAAVDPYSDNVIVQFADGRVLRGRQALIDWMRPQQDWSVPGLATQGVTKGLQWYRAQINAPEEDGSIIEMREVRWVENGRPLRRTYSARWRNTGGVWRIVYERVSEDKPVTDERIRW